MWRFSDGRGDKTEELFEGMRYAVRLLVVAPALCSLRLRDYDGYDKAMMRVIPVLRGLVTGAAVK